MRERVHNRLYRIWLRMKIVITVRTKRPICVCYFSKGYVNLFQREKRRIIEMMI